MGDQDVQVVYISKPPVALPQAITEGDYDSILERLGDLEDGLDLGDLNDVDTTGAANGYALTYNAGDGKYELTEIAGAVETVTDTDSIDLTLSSGDLQAAVKYAGTGTANTAARSDHVLKNPKGKRGTFTATGILSSGTRNLVSTSFGPLEVDVPYLISGRFVVRGRNNVNSGTCNLKCRIGSDAGYPELTRTVQTVGGVPVDQEIIFGDADGDMFIVGTGSNLSITFSVQHNADDPVDLRDGFYRVQATPWR